MAVVPVRLLGPMRAVDPRSSHCASHVGSTSRISLLFFLHRTKFPSLHSQTRQSHVRICAASVTELDEEEPSAKVERWKRQTPTAREKFTYPQRGGNQKPNFPWRTSQSEPPFDKRSSDGDNRDLRFKRDDGRDSRADGPSDAGQRKLNREVPWDTQRRSYNSNRSNDSSYSAGDEQVASTSKREGERGRAGGRYTTKSNETPRFRGTSRYSQYDNGRNMHRAPWEQGPARAARANARDSRPPLPIERVLEKEDDDGDNTFERDGDFTEDSRFGSEETEGRGEKSAMARIVEKLRNIQNNNPPLRPKGEDLSLKSNRSLTENSVFLPRPGQPVFPGLDRRWSSPDHPIPKPAADALNERWELRKDVKFPWDKEEDEEEGEPVEKKKRVKPPSMAELTIPEDELKRLRGLGLMVRQRLKVGRLGVTPGIVEAIHNGWRTCEIVKVKCDGPPALNMKKTHEDLEKRTGGLVIWRSGSAAVVYRGKDYVPPSVRLAQEREEAERKKLMSLGLDEVEEGEAGQKVQGEEDGVLTESAPLEVSDASAEHDQAIILDQEPTELDIVDDILEGLGPRYADWTGNRPVPVDGDLILSPDIVFKRPFRLLPYGVKPKLNNFEMTDLRHLARPIPPHFVLGKNRGLAGLAAGIVKLWEKSEIVKIGVKRGVQNTNNERMAEDLKRLTGGTLLARDKEFIVLYRGKDFLPPAVQAALEERDAMARALQEEEERVRMAGRSNAVQLADAPPEPSKVGTLEESLEAKATWETWQNSEEQRKAREAARKAARAQASQRIERKVDLAAQKKERAEKELAKLDLKMRPAEAPIDREHISEEERYMFRKLGLRMKAFLLIGRRGVFDGVVENMHLHWKHRELVKIIVKGTIAEVEGTAKMLEIESGGILVGIVTTSKGQAVIVYRGKNYQRPPELRPRHLLTKRQALKRSLEMQRKESLEKHILNLEKEIEKMKVGLSKMEEEASEGESAETNSRVLSESRDNSGDIDEAEFEADADFDEFLEDDNDFPLYRGQKKNKGVKLDSIFRAEPLTRKERLQLRHEALKLGKAAHFNIGKSNVVAGLAKSIRLYFEKHALVKVGVKGRAKGTPVAEIVQQIEDATGGVLVSTEPSKLIFYRGWPDGEERPDRVTDEPEELSSELRAALLQEEEVADPNDLSYLTKEEAAMVGVEYGGNSEAQREVSAGDVDRDDEDELGINSWNEEEWDSDDEEEEEDWEDDFESDETEGLEFQEGDEVVDEFNESEEPSKEDSEKKVLIKIQSEV